MRAGRPTVDYIAVARFRAALREFDNASEEAARRAGLTVQRYLLLLMVKGSPRGDERATVNEVADRLKLAPHSITGAVSRAVQAGLVSREPCNEDRRRIWIRLTPEGERLLDHVVTALAEQRESLLRAIDAAARGAHAIPPVQPAKRRGHGGGGATR